MLDNYKPKYYEIITRNKFRVAMDYTIKRCCLIFTILEINDRLLSI